MWLQSCSWFFDHHWRSFFPFSSLPKTATFFFIFMRVSKNIHLIFLSLYILANSTGKKEGNMCNVSLCIGRKCIFVRRKKYLVSADSAIDTIYKWFMLQLVINQKIPMQSISIYLFCHIHIQISTFIMCMHLLGEIPGIDFNGS